jgi:general secretion pathway protein A
MTGDAGTGKTTLVRKFLVSIPTACAQFSVIVNPALTRSEFLEAILMDFGVQEIASSKAVRLSIFNDLLLRAHTEGKTSVLVIDEAHLLTADLIDEIRLLSNFETSEQKLLQIVLVGQPELDAVLNLESMRQVKQRIAIRTHIEPLAAAEVARYMQSRWKRASAQRPLPFSDDAIELVTRASGGIPRIVNAISDAALLNAYGCTTTVIGGEQVREVLRDLQILVPEPAPMGTGTRDPSYRECVQVPIRLKTVERYLPDEPRPPRLIRLANWFRGAATQAR